MSDLSINLQGFVSQRLVRTVDGKRCAAIEILLNSPRIADLIKAGEVMEIKEVMEKSEPMGMQTFDMALYNLYKSGKISLDEALRNADAENNLRLKIELSEKGAAHAAAAKSDDKESEEKEQKAAAKKDALGGLSLVEHEDDEEEAAEGAASFKLPEDGGESVRSAG